MSNYQVSFAIDIFDCESSTDAAREAWERLTRPGYCPIAEVWEAHFISEPRGVVEEIELAANPLAADRVAVELIAAIRKICRNWSSGDLAGAVHEAEQLAEDVEQALPEVAA